MCVASVCVFMHRDKNIVLGVHGGDFTAAGPKRSLDWFEGQMKQRDTVTAPTQAHHPSARQMILLKLRG